MPTEGYDRHSEVVLAGQDGKSRRRATDDFHDLCERSGSFLGAHDVAVLRQAQGCLGRHVGTGAAWDVVHHDRRLDSVGHRSEVLVEAFLRRLVVVGDDDEDAIDAHLIDLFRQRHHGRRRVPSRSCQHPNPVVALLSHYLDNSDPLCRAHGNAFAGRSARYDAIHTALDLPVDQGAKRGFIERSVPLERSDDGGESSSPASDH